MLYQIQVNANENIRMPLLLIRSYCVLQYTFLEPPSRACSPPSEAW